MELFKLDRGGPNWSHCRCRATGDHDGRDPLLWRWREDYVDDHELHYHQSSCRVHYHPVSCRSGAQRQPRDGDNCHSSASHDHLLWSGGLQHERGIQRHLDLQVHEHELVPDWRLRHLVNRRQRLPCCNVGCGYLPELDERCYDLGCQLLAWCQSAVQLIVQHFSEECHHCWASHHHWLLDVELGVDRGRLNSAWTSLDFHQHRPDVQRVDVPSHFVIIIIHAVFFVASGQLQYDRTFQLNSERRLYHFFDEFDVTVSLRRLHIPGFGKLVGVSWTCERLVNLVIQLWDTVKLFGCFFKQLDACSDVEHVNSHDFELGDFIAFRCARYGILEWDIDKLAVIVEQLDNLVKQLRQHRLVQPNVRAKHHELDWRACERRIIHASDRLRRVRQLHAGL